MNKILKLRASVQKSQVVFREKTMKHDVMKGLVQVLMIGTMGLAFITPAGADTIYSENNPSQTTMQSYALGGTDLSRWGAYFPYSVGWTQTGTYSNVSISADVNLGGTGSSFLTTQVGAGTIVADQIASGTFGPVLNSGSNPYPSWVTIFTGLTLGPGTYFLTLNGDAYGGGWRFDTSIAPALGSGVTAAGESWGYCDTANTYETCGSYDPANTQFADSLGLRVDVQGTPSPVPEPSSLLLLAFGLLGLGGTVTVRRKFIS